MRLLLNSIAALFLEVRVVFGEAEVAVLMRSKCAVSGVRRRWDYYMSINF